MTPATPPGLSAASKPAQPASVRWALLGLCLTMLMPSLDTSIANAGLPVLAQAFGAPFQAVQWIVLAYLLAITTLIVGAGRLGDMLGRRRLLLAGIALFTAASALCGLAPSLAWLIAARAAQGLGAAVMMALCMASVSETVAKEKTGSTMGLLGTMSAIGTTLGPSLGGLLMAGPGWRTIFLINVPLGIINFFLIQRYLPADRQTAQDRARLASFDKTGMLMLALTLAAYALAMTMGRGHFGALNAGLLLAAACGLALFLRVEAKATAPLLRLAMFRNPALSTSLASNMLVATVMMSTLVVGPFYLSLALGLLAAQVGLALSVGPLFSALSGVPAGRMVDCFGARRMSLAGLCGMLAGCIALALLPASLGIAGYLLPLVCLTPCYALFQAANNTAIMSDIAADQRGLVSGMLSLSRNLGLITGASVMGALFALATAASDISSADPAAVATGMHVTFAVAAGLIFVALACVWVASRLLRQKQTAQ
ncbi:MFS transporter [Undibacterium sp. TJN19]|uniref:MFS transporter n=1 Tax=Undibacterium sp. TJN19 TaxID=3413055 RepID=UPI003BF18620